MTLRFGLLLLAAGCAACFTDPPAPQRVPAETGSSTGDTPGTESSSGEDSSSSGDPFATSTFGSSTSGGPVFGCEDAFDAQSCSAASDLGSEQCSWHVTYSHDTDTCDPWATDGGACVIEQGLDGCPGPEATCLSDGSWYYRVIDGAVEVVDATDLCYGLSAFTPCPWPDDDPDETAGSSVGSSASTAGSGTTGGGETGASASSVGDGETSGGTSGGTGGWTLQEEIEAVCACACDQ